MKLDDWLENLTNLVKREEKDLDKLFSKFEKGSKEYKMFLRILEESKKAAVSGQYHIAIPFIHRLYDRCHNEDETVKKIVEILKSELKFCDFEFVGGPHIPEGGFVNIRW